MGHAASLELYRDPPKTYNYPKGSPYVDLFQISVFLCVWTFLPPHFKHTCMHSCTHTLLPHMHTLTYKHAYTYVHTIITTQIITTHTIPIHKHRHTIITPPTHKHSAEDKYTLTYVDRQPMYHSRRLGGERLLEFGTTCTAVVVQGHAVAVGSVGDSGAILGR